MPSCVGGAGLRSGNGAAGLSSGSEEVGKGARLPVIPLSLHRAQPGPPGNFQKAIPNDPQLYGRTFSAQALTRSLAAPAGAAWTNPIEFTFLP